MLCSYFVQGTDICQEQERTLILNCVCVCVYSINKLLIKLGTMSPERALFHLSSHETCLLSLISLFFEK